MPRRRRFDTPGLLHHVMNRGIARRTVFETARDVRYFNRTRRRDGPLFRGRYRAKPVRTTRYLHILIRYVDQNAPQARLASTGLAYPWGSAALYVRARRPRWLATRYVDGVMGDPSPGHRRAAYVRAFGRSIDSEEAKIVERRLEHPATADDWDDLVGAAPPRVLAWMRRKARLADGTKPGLPYVTTGSVLRLVAEQRERRGELVCRPAGTRRRDAWPVLRVGLLRDLSGHTHAEIGRRTGCSPNQAARRVEQHARLLESDEDYAELASKLAADCLADH